MRYSYWIVHIKFSNATKTPLQAFRKQGMHETSKWPAIIREVETTAYEKRRSTDEGTDQSITPRTHRKSLWEFP